jgi:hypothetical protein
MAPFHRFALAALLLGFSGRPCCGQEGSSGLHNAGIRAAGNLTDWGHNGIGGLARRTLAFLSDDTLAVYVCANECRLIVATIVGAEVHPAAVRIAPSSITHLRRAGTGGILAWSDRDGQAKLYSIDLQTETDVPTVLMVSGTGVTVAAANATKLIDVYEISEMKKPKFQMSINEDDLMSISDETLLVRHGNELTVKGFDGGVVSSFSLNRKNQCAAEIISMDKIYLDPCGKNVVVDGRGKRLAHLQSPGGWGSRLRWSADGDRILYDRFVEPPLRHVGKAVLALATLGAGALEEEPDRMQIRVVDTLTGGVCFDWKSQKHAAAQIAFGYEPHADISPSGRYIALINENSLKVYSLPEICR